MEIGEEYEFDENVSMYSALPSEVNITLGELDLLSEQVFTAFEEELEIKTDNEVSIKNEIKNENIKEDYEIYQFSNVQKESKILYKSDGTVLEFEINGEDEKIRIIDSNECLNNLEKSQLEPVEFSSRYYLAPQKTNDFDNILEDKQNENASNIESESSDLLTAELGPPFGHFSSSISLIEKSH